MRGIAMQSLVGIWKLVEARAFDDADHEVSSPLGPKPMGGLFVEAERIMVIAAAHRLIDEAGVVGARQSKKERLQVGGTSPERLPALAWPGRTMIAKPGSILLAGGQQDVTGRAALAAHRDRSRGAQMGIPGRLSNRRYCRRAKLAARTRHRFLWRLDGSPKVRFATDSSRTVGPPSRRERLSAALSRWSLGMPGQLRKRRWDYQFESAFLQRRVRCEPISPAGASPAYGA